MAEQITTISGDSEVENLKQQLADAQRKIAEQGKILSEQAGYIEQADAVAAVIMSDDELKNRIRSAYEKGGQQKAEEPKKEEAIDMANPKIDELTKDVGEVKKSQRIKAITDFEDRVGISSLPEDQRTEARKKIESYINTFGQSVTNVPLDKVNDVLDAAYKAVNVETLVKEGKMEGIAEVYTNQSGGVPHLRGRSLEPDSQPAVTPQQAEWAKKLNVPVEKVVETVKNIDNETTRVSLSEKNKEKRDRGEE